MLVVVVVVAWWSTANDRRDSRSKAGRRRDRISSPDARNEQIDRTFSAFIVPTIICGVVTTSSPGKEVHLCAPLASLECIE